MPQQDIEDDDVLFSVDLEARKAGLRAQLAVFAKVRAYCMPQHSCCCLVLTPGIPATMAI